MTTKIDSTQVVFDEQSSSPATPASGKVALYAKTDGNLYQKNGATETQLGGGGGGMTSFTVAGDSGPSQTISDGNTLTIRGDSLSPIATVASATDTIDIALTTVPASLGGTGQSTYADGDLLYGGVAPSVNKLAIGTAGQVLTVVGGLPAWAAASGAASFAELRYQVAQNTAGQSISGATWTTITLNTEASDPNSIVTIASNQFTPIAGTYAVQVIVSLATASARATAMRLRNITAGTTSISGVNDQTAAAAKQTGMIGMFAANGTDQYAVQIFIASTGGTVGVPINLAAVGDEIYMTVLLTKVD